MKAAIIEDLALPRKVNFSRALNFCQIGPHLIEQPGVKPTLYGISGLVLTVYGLLTVRSQPPPSS